MNYPICIFTMHHINPNKDDITLSPDTLKSALQKILDLGYHFLSYLEFIEILKNRKKIEKKSVLLTFDDGYFDFYRYGFSVLKELKIPAVCFLITDTLRDKKRENYDLPHKAHTSLDYQKDLDYFLNLSEIREMHASGLVEFDSHTKTHFSCRSEDEELLKKEFLDSKQKIIEFFPQRKEFGFCYPKGHFSKTALRVIKECGYDFAFSTIDGGFCAGDDIFKIRRIDISSAPKGDKDYLFKIEKKLRIYSMPYFGNLYSKFRNRKYKEG